MKKVVRYFTHAHNVEMCLQNGSFVRQHLDGFLVQYMNGDCMGEIKEIPSGMIEVPRERAIKLIPKCCR